MADRDELWTPLRESARRFSAARESAARESMVRRNRALAKGCDRDAWRDIAALGWLGLAIPEAQGGSGLDATALVPIAEATGAACLLEPLIAVAGVAAPLAAELADGAASHRVLRDIADGNVIVVLAHMEAAGGYDRASIATTAVRVPGGWLLDGEKSAVENADLFLVSARLPDGALGLFMVPRDTTGLTATPFRTADGRILAELRLAAVRVEADAHLGADDATSAVDAALDRGALLAVAEDLGAMDTLLADTLAHLRVRKQFGRPLAAFQMLQHRVVDMYLALEEARAVVEAAADAHDGGRVDFAAAVATAKVVGIRSARRIGREALQMHGGMGLSEELRVGRLFRRLVASEGRYGDADWHLGRFRALTRAARRTA